MSAGEIKKLTYSSGVTTDAPTVSNPTGAIVASELAISGSGTYNAVDVSGISSIQIAPSGGDITINGLANGTEGQIVHLWKSSASNKVTLGLASGSAATGDKIYWEQESNITFYSGSYGGATLVYTGGSWIMTGRDDSSKPRSNINRGSGDGNQNITEQTNTKVLFPTESFDYFSEMASSTFTPPIDGVYHLTANLILVTTGSATTINRVRAWFDVSGSAWEFWDLSTNATGSTTHNANGAVTLKLTTSDTVDVNVFVDTDGTAATTTSLVQEKSFFSSFYLGR